MFDVLRALGLAGTNSGSRYR